MNVWRIAGKAMFTIVTSRNTMNTASEESSRTFHSRDRAATTTEWTCISPGALDG